MVHAFKVGAIAVSADLYAKKRRLITAFLLGPIVTKSGLSQSNPGSEFSKKTYRCLLVRLGGFHFGSSPFFTDTTFWVGN
jgi:hypothetical protein